MSPFFPAFLPWCLNPSSGSGQWADHRTEMFSINYHNIQSGKRACGRTGLMGKRIHAFACGRWWTVETVNVII